MSAGQRSPGGLSESEARALAERVLSFSEADEARVNLESGLEGNTRFAVNQVTTAGDAENTVVTVTSAFGTREASARTNRLDDDALREVVATSERLARLVPENPERTPELEPQEYAEVSAYFESTAGLEPSRRARIAALSIEPSAKRGLQAAGFLSYGAGSEAVANNRGLFAYHRSTGLAYTTTVRTPAGDGSGWAGAAHGDLSRVDFEAAAERAIEKAERSRGAEPVEPGEWTVILEPTAVANLVRLLAFGLNARSADEGRSFFSKSGGGNRIGETLFDERVTLVSDPTDPDLLGTPFTSEGWPLGRVPWVENGSLRNLAVDRFWAQKQGTEPTGFATTLKMTGGATPLEEMIASTERGILVTRFWYIRSVDPRVLLYTGLTRDGTFLIENGRVSRPTFNLRFNESPALMLTRLEALGPAVRVNASESGDRSNPIVVPPLKVRGFTFTSVSEAV